MPRFVTKKYRKRFMPQAAVTGYDFGRARAARSMQVAAMRRMNTAVRGLQLARGEWKSVTTAIGLASNTTGAIALVNGIARGDDIAERTGRQVVMKSIFLRGISFVTPTTGIDQFQRILVVYDKQTNGAALTVAQVLDSASVYAQTNLENRQRFQILYDRTFSLNASGESGSQKGIKWYRKLNHPVTFNSGDAGTVADITTGSLYVIVVGSIADGDTDGGLNAQCRVRFEDK